jgi:hypothetical protein
LTSHLAAKSGDLPLKQSFGAERDAVEGVTQDRKILTSRFRDDEALALAIKEFYPELGLQSLDLVADRALCDEQLLSRAREALMAGGGLEGLQRI